MPTNAHGSSQHRGPAGDQRPRKERTQILSGVPRTRVRHAAHTAKRSAEHRRRLDMRTALAPMRCNGESRSPAPYAKCCKTTPFPKEMHPAVQMAACNHSRGSGHRSESDTRMRSFRAERTGLHTGSGLHRNELATSELARSPSPSAARTASGPWSARACDQEQILGSLAFPCPHIRERRVQDDRHPHGVPCTLWPSLALRTPLPLRLA